MECDGRKGEDGWRLEPERETVMAETIVLWNEVERVQATKSRRESEAPGEEGEAIKSPKRKVIRVESEETQD